MNITTDVNVIERARAEASKRWQSRESDRLPIDWLNEGMASGFVLGAQWALCTEWPIRAVAAGEQAEGDDQ